MVAEKDNRCEKFAFQESFNNLEDGSQDFTKIMISSPRIEASFINSGSGSQNLKGLKIQCDDKSILQYFKDVVLFGMTNLFNHDQKGSQTFPDFTFLKYLAMGESKIKTQIPVDIFNKLLGSMANGSNDKRGATSSNNSTQHDNHTGKNRHMVAVSTPSVTTTTTIISLPNNPRPTPNHLRHFSRIVQSFKNSEGGLQDFSHAKINSTATGESFNNLGSGSQTFREAQIRCAEKSASPLKRDHVAHYSFNNNGKGSQCFNGFKLN